MPRRLRSRPLVGWVDPERVFLRVAGDAPWAIWLDGGPDATDGLSVITVPDPERAVVGVGEPDEGSTVMLERIGAELAPRAIDERQQRSTRSPLGWIGWFGYEFGARALGLPAAPTSTPDVAFAFVDRAIVFDHASRAVHLEWLEDEDEDEDEDDNEDDDDDAGAGGAASALFEWAVTTVAVIEEYVDREHPLEGAPSASLGDARAPRARWRHDATAYRRMIERCRAAIVRGDAYQLCLTNRVDVDVHVDPVETYRRLRRSSPSHHGGLLRFGETSLLSASPEQFLLIDPDGTVTTKPMKGTRPRAADPGRDADLRADLEGSDKERAENLMIVDLMRNDLGRIAELGTVDVPSLLAVEEYPHVHQLVSTVTARLRHPLTALDAVAAAFPAGSMTGAPKESAMRILHDLEQGPRGVYSGVFGCLAVDGGADLAMVIRAIVLTPDGASIGTGGGITALSDPDEEIEETRVKARALIAVLTGEPVGRIE